MRKPSSHCQELLRLASSPTVDNGILVETLRKLGSSHEPAVLPRFVPFVLYPEPAVALAARQAVRRLLQATPARDLVWLDQTLRRGCRQNGPGGRAAFEAWDRLRPGWLTQAAQEPQGLVVLLAASMHHSGYVRQAAVQLLARWSLQTPVAEDLEAGAEVPFVLLRLNDWVGPVQQAAVAAIEPRLVAEYAPQLVRCIYLVEQLAAYRRRDHEAVLQALRQFLSRAGRPALLAGLTATDRLVQRHCFTRLMEDSAANARAVVLAGLASSDTLVRVWAARAARRRLYGPDLVEALGQARRDRAVPVRMEAVYAFIDDHPELQVLLLDPCKSIRETVRFYIRKHATIDFAALYRQALRTATPARLPIILLALGETGSKSDAACLLPYTTKEQLRVRKAALWALGQLDPETAVPILFAALSDPHRGVRRTAWEALRPRADLLTPEQLQVWLPLREQYE